MSFTLRPARDADIPALAQLIPESVRGLSGGYYTPGQVESALAHIFGVDTRLIEDGTYFVAEADGQIVGGGGWSRRSTLFGGDERKAGAPDDLLDPATDPARVRAFFVHPDWARRGIGRALLSACESAAREAGFRSLELVATRPGEPLYTACGFDIVERFDIPVRGGDPLPAARMAKVLAPPLPS
ncbi:MAG TPA: GNAT family N-acetyltransferase [Gemmataceae bacterium]|nr:GNAT family N-acetyltransferase [Gemmataceae bacterium]